MLLLVGCVLPVDGGDTGSPSSGGALQDGDFTVSWWWGESWGTGACVNLSLTNGGAERSDWRAVLDLDAAVDEWTWLDDGLHPEGTSELEWLPTGETALAAGETVSALYCAEPTADPAGLTVWAVDGGDAGEEDVAGTLEDTTGTIWLSYRSAGQRSGVDCLELELINVSAGTLDGWRLDMEMTGESAVVETWNTYALATGSALSLIPEGDITVAPYGSWTGWVCLEPLVTPVSATISGQ